MTMHLIGFPHTTLDGHSTCAYTQKIRKFIRMGWGDDLIVYHGSDEVVDEDALPVWPDDATWARFNARVIGELRQNVKPRDLLLMAGGLSQKPIADALPYLLACESGVGYTGITQQPAAYESAAWRSHVYGMYRLDGRPYDTVIHNYFEPSDWPYLNGGGGDYLLFVGRLIRRKGPNIAAEIARRAGMKLVVVGPGATHVSESQIVADEITIEGDVEYRGVLSGDDLALVMAEAAAMIVPTLYVEPFGGVAVEAQMCGTPVIASDWGAFVETVPEDCRFGTLLEAEEALENALSYDPGQIRRNAVDRWGLDAIKPRYERWFDTLQTLYHGGYYAERARA